MPICDPPLSARKGICMQMYQYFNDYKGLYRREYWQGDCIIFGASMRGYPVYRADRGGNTILQIGSMLEFRRGCTEVNRVLLEKLARKIFAREGDEVILLGCNSSFERMENLLGCVVQERAEVHAEDRSPLMRLTETMA